MRRKSIRLDSVAYLEPGRTFSVTIGTWPRFPVFRDLPFGRACVEQLAVVRAATSTSIYAYCLMPDHVHLLIGVSARVSLPAIVGQWKSRCYTAWRRRGHEAGFWQRSYYDHALRQDEDLFRATEYILNNPVRAGLVSRREDYELCGSFEFNL